MNYLVSATKDTASGFLSIDEDVPIKAESAKDACIQYMIEAGFGDGGFTETASIGTNAKPCIRYCVQNHRFKAFIYVMKQL